MYINYFNDVWELYYKWAKNILYKNKLITATADIVLSDIPGEFFNHSVPLVKNPEELDVAQISQVLNQAHEKAAIYLLEEHQKLGFLEFLIRQGFTLESRDSWMGYDPNTYQNSGINSEVITITPQTFTDYEKVLGKVFTDFPGNDKYLEICKKILEGDIKSEIEDLRSDSYLIYEDGRPVAGAGMFYSASENFAYLHDAGTLEEARGKGYQSDLIKFRVNKALENGINRIFSSVEQGTQSWSNSIKCGLNQMHTGNLLIKK